MPQRYKLFSIPPNFLRIICISEHFGIPFSSSKRHMSHGFREDFTIPSINILEETELDIASLAITIFSENCLHISNCFCMIYVHKPEWYLRVKEQRDVIEYMYDDDVDLSGWELRKALGLLSKGNTTIFEWLHSPKIYYMDRICSVRPSRDWTSPIAGCPWVTCFLGQSWRGNAIPV